MCVCVCVCVCVFVCICIYVYLYIYIYIYIYIYLPGEKVFTIRTSRGKCVVVNFYVLHWLPLATHGWRARFYWRGFMTIFSKYMNHFELDVVIEGRRLS